ncbi:MAG: ribosomal RNA small subunit methyltransferase A [Chloroflexi bacterium]|nr:ribosomal RNA small subunit methyltransferase A [Chloroflexota bacterium]
MTTPVARPKKSLGQHFLVDMRVLSRISAAAEISPHDVVVEVGPGRGILTKHLAERASRVVAVELDEALASWLSGDLADRSNVEVVCADARELDLARLVRPDTPYKVAANLPYYAALPILRRFLEAEHKPELMVVMVQREVARKIAAAPGDMGLVSVAVQLYGRPRVVSYVPPGAFRPAPKVTSAILRIDVYPEPALDLDSEKRFFELVRAGFSARRKQLRNCLRDGLTLSGESADAILLGAGIDPTRRAQTLSIEEWGSLYSEWTALAPS